MNENEVNQNEVKEENIVEKKKNKKSIIIIAIVVIIALLLGVYKFVFNSPKNIFLRAMNNEYKQLEEMFDSLEKKNRYGDKTQSTESALNFDIKVQEGMLTEEQLALLNEINALNLTMNTEYNPKNKEVGYHMGLNHNTSSLLRLGLYGKPSSFYLDLKNYFDKYIEIPVEEYESLFENENMEDLKYIMSFVKDSFLSNLSEKDFKESKETIQLGSESVKTKKVTYVLTEKSTSILVSKMLKDMKDDSKFIESLAAISGEDKETLKQALEDAIDSLGETEESDDSIEISVYTKGIMNDTIKWSMVTNIDGSKSEMSYSNYQDVKRIYILDNDELIMSVVNKKEKDNVYKTTVTADTLKLVINSSKKDNDWNHTYKLTESESEVIINGEVSSLTKEVSKDKEYTTDTKFTVSLGAEDTEDLITIEITSNTTKKIGESITMPDMSGSVIYTSLTEEDINTLMTNIISNQNLIDFINKISVYMNNTSEDSDSYDYDDMNY